MKINFHASFWQLLVTTIALGFILVFQYIIFSAQDSKIILKEPSACTFDIFQQDMDKAITEHASASTEVKCGNEWRAIGWAYAKSFAIEAIKRGERSGTLQVICNQYRWRWKEETVNECVPVDKD